MGYKDIVVFLDPTPDTPGRLNVALSLASAHEARLLGVDVTAASAFEGPLHDAAVGLQDLFENALQQAGVDGAFKIADRKSNAWTDLYAHFADLVIATQHDKEAAASVLAAVPEEVLISSGVPMLILPPGWHSRPLGESIVVAWSSSREATRAMHDALPMLSKAQRVTIFEFGRPSAASFELGPALVAEHLIRHGVKAEVYTWPDAGDLTPVNALFACLDSQEADLIVAGAYGHSRFMEGLFGGVSHDLLQNPTMPLLMSH